MVGFGRVVLAIALAALTLASDVAESVSPVEKVLTMLQDLQEKVILEGRTEAKTYDKFACFCKDMTEEKAEEIEDGQALVDDLVSNINDLTSDRNLCDTSLEELNTDVAAVDKEMAEAHAANLKEVKEYTEDRQEITDSMGGIHQAEDFMSAGAHGKPAPALLASRRKIAKTVRSFLQLASNLGIDDPQYHEVFHSFLQEGKGVADPEVVNFEEHEDLEAQLGTMKNIEKDFESQRKQLDEKERKRIFAYDSFRQNRFDQKKLKEKNIAKQQKLKDKKGGELGRANQDLTEAQATLHDNQAYIKDLTEKCNSKSDEWDQRTNMRKAELAALTGAIDIISKRVTGKSALLLASNATRISEDFVSAAEDPVSDDDDEEGLVLLQVAPPRKRIGLLRAAAKHKEPIYPHEESVEAAVSLLKAKGDELKSEMLIKLVSEAQAQQLSGERRKRGADPFDKIKQLVTELVSRLQQEAADEATHKGWCAKELAKATVMRDDRATRISQVNSLLEKHNVARALLEDEIKSLGKEIDELDDLKEKMQKTRDAEKAENEATVAEAKEGKQAIEDAIEVLKGFYAPSLLQRSGREEPAGSQAEAGGIMSMMDVIKSDFVRTIEVTGEEEEKAVRDFTELMRSTDLSISTKTNGKEAKETEHTDLVATIAQEMGDLKQEQQQFDKALQELIELGPACLDTGMSYADRVAKRQQELESLNNALCLLDKEGPVKGDMQTC